MNDINVPILSSPLIASTGRTGPSVFSDVKYSL